jgi:hypothetical protein
VGLKYRRIGALALSAGLLLSLIGAGTALAADPPADGIVWDGTARVQWVDRVDGVMTGAQVRVMYYRAGDPFPGILGGTFITNSRGVALITGIPRAIEGAEPVLLDIRADLATATPDDNGCTTYESWIAQRSGVTSRQLASILLQTSFRSWPVVNCG